MESTDLIDVKLKELLVHALVVYGVEDVGHRCSNEGCIEMNASSGPFYNQMRRRPPHGDFLKATRLCLSGRGKSRAEETVTNL